MKKIKYSEIVKELNNNSIKVYSKLDNDTEFKNISSISNSNDENISFFSNNKYIDHLKSTKAKACLVNKENSKYLPKNCEAIVVENPYYAFAIISNLFSKKIITSNGNVSKNIFIDKNVQFHLNVQVDSFSSFYENSNIHENCIIGANTKIGPNVTIHKNCLIQDNVSISNSIIMENCEIQSGARIGGDGFGFEEKSKQKIYHNGDVIIKNNSIIGSNTTIDRAVFGSTIIGEYSHIDNLVQIAHNVILGKHSIIAAQVGIAGSTIIGDYVKIGGQAGISGHLKIGNKVTIAGKSGVTKNINDNSTVAGFPAKDINKWKREIINIGRKNDIK